MQTRNDYDIKIRTFLTAIGAWLGLFAVRMVLGAEFWIAGTGKYKAGAAGNWFEGIPFPFPFSLLSADVNWFLATWSEMLFAICLFLGFATRFASVSLIVVTVVAILAVHMPERRIDGDWLPVGIGSLAEFANGWRISEKCADGYCTGNYKLPLMYIIMFVPLVLLGAGRLSLDYLLGTLLGRNPREN